MRRISWNQPGLDPGSMTPEFLSSFKLRPAPLEVRQEHWYIFPNESGKWTLTSRWGREIGALLELWQDPRYSSWAETGMSGNFLSCTKGVKDPLEAQEGKWDFSQDATAEKGLISCWGENLLDFLELRWETWGSSRVTTEISGACSCYLRKVQSHASCEGPLRIPLHSVPGPRSSSGVAAKTSVFPSNADMDLGVPIEFQQWSQASSRVETCKFAFLSSSKSSVRVPVEWHRDLWLSLEVPGAATAVNFVLVDCRGDSHATAG